MNPSRFRRRLLAWFDHSQRPLPWRRNRDPYQIWVSEVMLQQTTVAAVIAYFERFIRAFPDVRRLARADEQQVLKLWEGLGYYRRARHLHQAARAICESHDGEMPTAAANWQKLPGVGRYILGAVLSQAFDQRHPIVEANSQRVLCRLFAQSADPATSGTRKWLWATAEALLPKKRIGDFNQAMMELGALVCTPVNPNCSECPVALDCAARRQGKQDAIPTKSHRPRPVNVCEVALVVRRGQRYLIARRPADALRWANMWEFPHGEVRAGESVDHAARRLLRELTGLRGEIGTDVATIRHGVTRFHICMTAVEVEAASGNFASQFYPTAKWATRGFLAQYPVSSPQRKLIEMVCKSSRQRRLF